MFTIRYKVYNMEYERLHLLCLNCENMEGCGEKEIQVDKEGDGVQEEE